jgi:integrase
MAHVEKRRQKYRVRWRDCSGQQRVRTCPDRKTAEKVRLEVERAAVLGEEQREPEPVRREPDVEELMREFLRDRSRSRAPASLRRYACDLDTALGWLRRKMRGNGRLSPQILSKRLLEDMYDDLLAHGRHGRPRKPVTVKKIVSIFELMWAWAHNDDRYAGIVPPPRRIEMSNGPQDPVLAPTWAQMDACVATTSGWVRKLAVVLRFTGLRVQQVMRLRWEDVDLEKALLKIRGELGKTRCERTGRFIPISQHLVKELRQWGPGEGHIVPCGNRHEEGARGREAKGRDVARAWARAGIPSSIWRQRPHHAFRKGFKTELTRAGARWEAVEHLLGHQVGDSVTARYLDPTALPLREAVDLIPPLGQHLFVVPEQPAEPHAS